MTSKDSGRSGTRRDAKRADKKRDATKAHSAGYGKSPSHRKRADKKSAAAKARSVASGKSASPRARVSGALLTTADEIKAECALRYATNFDDCNKFVKAVARRFFEPDLFSGPNMNADAIIAEMNGSAIWRNLQKSHSQAIADAIAGRFVIGGMMSVELGDGHGHLAIVVGDPGQASGTVTVPICYAGSLSPTGRVQRRRVSETFGAQRAQNGEIRYYSRTTQVSATPEVLDRLIDYLRGIRDGD